MSNILRGKLCFKGDPGKDAYVIQILEGTIYDIPAGESSDTTVNYPEGFTKENTAIISAITKSTLLSNESTYWTTKDSNIAVNMVELNANNISISISNPTSNSTNAGFKIAIMKID